MKTLLLLLCSISIFAQTAWKPLLDSPNAFVQYGGAAPFVLKDGMLTGTTVHNEPNSFYATKKQYEDFILEFEVWMESGGNSGVQFRSQVDTTNTVYGYQSDIDTSPRKWTAGIYDEARRGWLCPPTQSQNARDAFKNGQWNTIRIEAIDSSIQTWVNAIPVSNMVDTLRTKGFIAFQVHSISNETKAGKSVKWRNVRIIETNLTANDRPSAAPQISYLDHALTNEEIEAGWYFLVDSQTFELKESQYLKHSIPFDSFALSVDFKLQSDSKGQLSYIVDTANQTSLQYALQAPNEVTNHSVGALKDLVKPRNISEFTNPNLRYNIDQFNRLKIVVEGKKVAHWLNNMLVLEYDLDNQIFGALLEKAGIKISQQSKLHELNWSVDTGSILFKNVKLKKL